MRYIVTGGLGFIGSHVTDLLIDEGHDVYIVDNLSTGKFQNINPKAHFIQGDIRDKDIFEGIGKVDTVFHLAALARIQPSIQDPVSANDVNVNGTLNILEYCRKYGVKIVFSGSSSIYSGENLPITEESEKYPKSPYSLQKHICEQYIRLYGELYGLKYTILRYFNVYGERQILEGAYAAVVGIFLNQKSEGKALTITNDGEQRRDMTYVRDVAKANVMATNWPSSEYNIGTGKNYSMNELADMIGGNIEYIGERAGEARQTLADNSKARFEGWEPTVDISDWIKSQS
jgi:UDP-glucose 4-epimerase